MSSIWKSSLHHRVQMTHSTDYYSLTSLPQEIIQGLGVPRISPILKWGLCGASWNPVNLMIQSEWSQKNLSRNTAVVWTPHCRVLLSALALQSARNWNFSSGKVHAGSIIVVIIWAIWWSKANLQNLVIHTSRALLSWTNPRSVNGASTLSCCHMTQIPEDTEVAERPQWSSTQIFLSHS